MTLDMTETSRKGKRWGSLITVAEYSIIYYYLSHQHDMHVQMHKIIINVHTNTW